ncbi:NEW3 domain-containing protein [Streptomyces lichenis]|uniref:NEW3 domain-containing protein n=1 Tax=Streptomyces lichenis TaxID=2306967 RepID=A0ABT0I8Y9_9ACTN|nr:NEW3 domain-containing protein [Streptomyces lichenis]MCK8677790.1 NEW3 domain-containing protein [Streptomyces lichenis]
MPLFPSAPRRALAALALAVVALTAPVGAATAAPSAAGAAPAPARAAEPTRVAVSAVDLDGPAVSEVKVTVTNTGPDRMRGLKVSFRGPAGWAVQPSVAAVPEAVRPGASATAAFRIQVPERRPGFTLRTFTATATYQGGDGRGSATGSRVERSGPVLARLSDAYDNVGATDEGNTAPGDFDGEGNSFSTQKLAAAGLAPGAPVTALGASLSWPAAAPGTKNNASAKGQAVQLSGQGKRLVFLGSGAGLGATGTATVIYTDGTSTSGAIGFPNWSFQEATAHGATLVASTDGRNRPDGYGNAGTAYRVFAHSVELDPAKRVELVVLPANGSVRLFDLAIAP